MSHFTVMVIGDNVDEQLAPFDENLEVPRYIEYTKEQLIENFKTERNAYAATIYTEFLKNPEAYKKNCSNDRHIEYLEKEFPQRLKWSDEDIYKHQLKMYDPEQIGSEGEVYSEYNPNSKWDWYEIGGRWAGLLRVDKTKQYALPNFSWGWSEEEKEIRSDGTYTDSAYKKDILNWNELKTFAVLKDGKWYSSGDMGWWGMVSNEKNNWEDILEELKKSINNNELVTIVDCHI